VEEQSSTVASQILDTFGAEVSVHDTLNTAARHAVDAEVQPDLRRGEPHFIARASPDHTAPEA
jgi:hypothetical protein